jgi:hypothetical protein
VTGAGGSVPVAALTLDFENICSRVGKSVEMLKVYSGELVLLRVDRFRIAIGRGMATKIIARRQV